MVGADFRKYRCSNVFLVVVEKVIINFTYFDSAQYREMIVKHCPWGRPGGGAPAEHIRRGNILAHGLFPESGTVSRELRSNSENFTVYKTIPI